MSGKAENKNLAQKQDKRQSSKEDVPRDKKTGSKEQARHSQSAEEQAVREPRDQGTQQQPPATQHALQERQIKRLDEHLQQLQRLKKSSKKHDEVSKALQGAVEEFGKLRSAIASNYDETNKQLDSKTKENERLRKENERLRKENEELRKESEGPRKENDLLQKKDTESKTSLSEMAAERMRRNNPCVEDLSDLHRPSALRERWEDVFSHGQYWSTFSQLTKRGVADDDVIQLLYRVCQVVDETCRKDANPTDPQPDKTQQTVERCLDNLRREVQGVEVELLASFVRDLADICLHMRRHEIALEVDFSCDPGSAYDADRYRTEDDSRPPAPGAVVKLVLQPPLLRSGDGPVLSKGLVVLADSGDKTRAAQTAASKHGGHTPAASAGNAASSRSSTQTTGTPSVKDKQAPGNAPATSAPDEPPEDYDYPGGEPHPRLAPAKNPGHPKPGRKSLFQQ